MFVFDRNMVGSSVVIICLVFVGFAILYMQPAYDSYGRPASRTSKPRAMEKLLVTAVMLAIYAGICFGLYFFGTNDMHNRKATNIKSVSAAMGLHSDQTYPFALAADLNASTTGAAMADDTFVAGALTAVDNQIMLPVSFTHGGDSFILQIPLSRISFPHDGATQTMSIQLPDARYPDAHVQIKHSSCKLQIRDLFPVCKRTELGRTLVLGATTQAQGLHPLVQKTLQHATITLPGDVYARLLAGKPAA